MTPPANYPGTAPPSPGALQEDSFGMRDADYREMLAMMIEGFALCEIICDAEGKPSDYRFLRINAAFEEILGMKAEAVIGRTVRELFPEIEPWWIETYGRIALTGGKTRFEHYFPPLQKHFEVTAYSPRRGEFAVVFCDITTRKKAELDLCASERRYRLVVENCADVLLEVDGQRRFLYLSPNFSSIFGYEPREVLGMHALDLMHPADRAATLTDRPFGSEIRNLVFRHRHKNGSWLWVEMNGREFETPSGKQRGVCILRDITKQRAADEQILRSQRMESIGTLASGVAHDLNNILAPILMSASILQDRVSPDLRSLIAAIMESAQRGADIVRQVLTFARGLEGERINLQLRHLIKEVVEITRETFPKSITIRSGVPKDLWTVIGDSTQLHQVLLNLFINARDAMPNGGQLTVRAENQVLDADYAALPSDARPGQYVVVSVADSGTGISPKVIDKIFDPFFTTKEVGKGTGLGLSTVIGIVRNHGGFVKVYSELGRGSTFKVHLPANPGGTPGSQPSGQSELAFGKGEWVLLADDEPLIRRITAEMLTRNGYNVLIATDGIDAISIYAQHMKEIKVVLTDLMMPLLDGVALTRALKKMDPNVRIVASTGQADDPRRPEFERLGIKAFLLKPYVAEKLLSAIHEAIHS